MNNLSDTAIKNAKPGIKDSKATDKPYKLYDGLGLYVEVFPAGGKLWRMKFKPSLFQYHPCQSEAWLFPFIPSLYLDMVPHHDPMIPTWFDCPKIVFGSATATIESSDPVEYFVIAQTPGSQPLNIGSSILPLDLDIAGIAGQFPDGVFEPETITGTVFLETGRTIHNQAIGVA